MAVTPRTLWKTVDIGTWMKEEQNGVAEALFDFKALRTASLVQVVRLTSMALASLPCRAGILLAVVERPKKRERSTGKRYIVAVRESTNDLSS